MIDSAKIREHMDVVGSDGAHVGTVDGLDGQRIKLTKSDSAAGGEHHFIALADVASVDQSVKLSKTAADARSGWQAA